MVKRGRRAGENVRQLAFKRRVKAITSFISAAFVIIIPTLYINILRNFLQQLTRNNSSQEQSSLTIPPIFYIMLLMVSLCLAANGVVEWKSANRADQGAKGEEVIAQELSESLEMIELSLML